MLVELFANRFRSVRDDCAVINEKELIITLRLPSSAALIPFKVLFRFVPSQDMDEGLHEVRPSMKGLKLTDALMNLF